MVAFEAGNTVRWSKPMLCDETGKHVFSGNAKGGYAVSSGKETCVSRQRAVPKTQAARGFFEACARLEFFNCAKRIHQKLNSDV